MQNVSAAESEELIQFKKKRGDYLTAPFDPRFPNTNQTRNCYQNYLDYYRCTKILEEKGQDIKLCDWYRRVFKSLCPISWAETSRKRIVAAELEDKKKDAILTNGNEITVLKVKRWDDERAAGTFAGKI